MAIQDGFVGTIGNTPLIKLHWPSEQTGCTILAKAEFLNPGGSIKDRAALAIIRDAEANGLLKPGDTIVEGTAGNTGIGIGLVGNALGYPVVIVMPETQSQEKKDALRLCGVDLRLVKALPYKDPGNYVRYSEALAKELGGFWANQFDNTANAEGHYATTGREIMEQTGGAFDAFTCAVGTGGTIAGVSRAIKETNAAIKVVLTDPMGSGLYNHYVNGELKAEGGSITEGIGQGRITENLALAQIDEAQRVDDPAALNVIYNLLKHDGLVVGGSSGINVAGAMEIARKLGPGHTIVTLLCDSGTRYQSKLFNPAFLKEKGLPTPDWME